MNARSGSGIVFAGSGTAGHLYPGVRIASDLVEARLVTERDIVFVGAARGTGREAVEKAGFSFVELDGAMPLRGKSPLGAALSVAGTGRAFLHAWKLLGDLAPAAVVGIGGYASFPVLSAARARGVPVTVLQVDAVFGLASAFGAMAAKVVPVAFPASAATFERSRMGRFALVRGVEPRPVMPCTRPEMECLDPRRNRGEARESLGLDPSRALVVFLGGSLGAAPVNQAAFSAFRRWRGRGAPQVVVVTGPRYFDDEASRYLAELDRNDGSAAGRSAFRAERSRRPESSPGSRSRRSEALGPGLAAALGVSPHQVLVVSAKPAFAVVAFVTEMARLYAAADLVVARAGAATVGELAVTGTPAVLMPSSFVPGDHQRPNAEALARSGGAVVAEDSQAELIPSVVERLLESPDKLAKMAEAGVRAAAAPQRAYEVVAEVAGLGSHPAGRPGHDRHPRSRSEVAP